MTNLKLNTLVPGLLVSLKTTISGNISYRTKDVVADATPVTGTESIVAWETTRTITDAAEYEAAKKVRSKARSLVSSVCVASAFGLLCPENKARELSDAVLEGQRIAADFNAVSRITRIGVFAITGKVASDDEQAIRAINSEMADLIEQMRDGAANLDPAAIREAANKARDVSMMLTPATQERVGAAIEIARKEARRIVKAGETAALQVDASVIAALAHGRTAFLDVDMAQGEVAAPATVAAAVDFIETPTDIGVAVRDQTGTAPVLDIVDAEFTEIATPVATPVATLEVEATMWDRAMSGVDDGEQDNDTAES